VEDLHVGALGVGKLEVLEDNVALDLFRLVALLGQGVDEWLAVDGLEDLVGSTARRGQSSKGGRRLAQTHRSHHDGKEDSEDLARAHFVGDDQRAAVPERKAVQAKHDEKHEAVDGAAEEGAPGRDLARNSDLAAETLVLLLLAVERGDSSDRREHLGCK